jgi:major vault protein
MVNENLGRDRDLVLAPGEFAFVLDTTKGLVNTIVGPNKISMSNTDQPVVWDKKTLRFARCDADKAIQSNPIAPEGFYIALYNPAEDAKNPPTLVHPREGSSANSIPLNVGHRVNIPGPVHFPLWPGQMANVIQGHHLRSNQYVLAQVYNDVEATANWQTAVLKPQAGGDTPVVTPRSFTPGQLLIIKGTDVAFFIPPTGIKVVPEGDDESKVFIREAVTLERLEYCILLDEDGNKRFVQGPDVVFPEPTEQFITKDNQRKFRAIELNETTGIYVKVIADYDEEILSGDPNVKNTLIRHKAGDELFITGKEQAIYYQREEHSVIRYGDQTKHYAVAVPAGEGRYVLNRKSGVIDLVRGPKMLLCDPRSEVIVRRVLADKTVELWYPNNATVLKVNRELQQALAALASAATPDATQYEAGRQIRSSSLMAMNYSDEQALKSSRQIAGDTFARDTKFTPPRTITLDTKYEGAVSISVWAGYAVLIVDKTGHRRVVVGPETVLLAYDETLAPLELSTGKPKANTNLFRTVYLRVHNNAVSDIVTVETSDLVPVNITLSYRVNFIGEPERWFDVENYVKLLCDHVRSLIRNAAKRKGIEEFYAQAIDIIRDTVLGIGTPRPGRTFQENGMQVYDIEVLNVAISNTNVATMLNQAQMSALQSALQISSEERFLATTLRSEDIKRQLASTKADTVVKNAESLSREITANLDTSLAKVAADVKVDTAKLQKQVDEQDLHTTLNDAQLARQKMTKTQELELAKAAIELEISRMVAESENIVKRAEAIDENLAVAITTFSDQALVEKISTALAPMAAVNGVSAADVLSQLFHGTPFAGVMKQLGTRSRMSVNKGNGESTAAQ